MKKFITILITIVLLLLTITVVKATDNQVTQITLENNKIMVNENEITTDTNNTVYLSNKMNNGGTSEEASKANIEIEKIINISKPGNYEFTGTLENGQISINANNIKGEVKIILNNANITCKDAPAIFVYSNNVKNENCKVTISTVKDTENTINGGKIKKVDVSNWSDKENILYYVEKGYDDDNKYIEQYKYDGAISSDISLTFEGEGILNIISSKKEGIESKMHITINNGIYIINSLDDAINAAADEESIITINNGTVIANILEDAEEGDGIDSNGYLYINGGTVYAFAHPGADNGLDSDLGTYINGGTVFSTGSMYEQVKTDNNTQIIQMQLSKEIDANESIAIVDTDNNVLFAFKTDRKVSTIVYSSDELKDKSVAVYTGNDIDGTVDEHGIYTEINNINLSNMYKQEENNPKTFNSNKNDENSNNNKTNLIFTIIVCVFVIGLLIIVVIADIKIKEPNKKMLIINLIIGILIGLILMLSIINIIPKNDKMDFDTYEMEFVPKRENNRPTLEKPHEEPIQKNEKFKNNI